MHRLCIRHMLKLRLDAVRKVSTTLIICPENQEGLLCSVLLVAIKQVGGVENLPLTRYQQMRLRVLQCACCHYHAPDLLAVLFH
jgi:hypothetical protein